MAKQGKALSPKEKAKEEIDERWYYSYLPNNISGGGTQPLIPIFVAEGLGGTVAQVGVITAANSMASVPSSVAWGNVSDRLGKRKLFVLLGFIGMGISFILMGLARNMEQYLLANIIMGLLATASGPIATVLIMETTSEKHWAGKIGKFSKIGGWGWVAGLVIGAVWLSLPFNSSDPSALRAMFMISALLSFLSAYMAYIWIDEPAGSHARVHRAKRENLVQVNLRHHEKSNYLPMRLHHIPGSGSLKKLRLHGVGLGHDLSYYFAVTFVFTMAFIMFYTIFPIFMVQRLGIIAGETFIVYLASSIASALFYERAGGIIEGKGAKKIQMAALAARMALIPSFLVLILLPFSHYLAIALLISLQAMMGICWAFISVSGSALASELSPSGARGESLGIYTAVQGVAAIFGALAGGAIAFALGYMAAILVPVALVLIALVLLARIKLISEEGVPVAGKGAPA